MNLNTSSAPLPIWRFVLVFDTCHVITRLHMQDPWPAALENVLITAQNEPKTKAEDSLRHVYAYEMAAPSLGVFGSAVHLLEYLGDTLFNQPGLNDLASLLEKAESLDATVAQVDLAEPLETLVIFCVPNIGSGVSQGREFHLAVPQSCLPVAQNWLNQVVTCLEYYPGGGLPYALDCSQWPRSQETDLHESIQATLDDVINQMSAHKLPVPAIQTVLQHGSKVTHAYARQIKASSLLDASISALRPRSRP